MTGTFGIRLLPGAWWLQGLSWESRSLTKPHRNGIWAKIKAGTRQGTRWGICCPWTSSSPWHGEAVRAFLAAWKFQLLEIPVCPKCSVRTKEIPSKREPKKLIQDPGVFWCCAKGKANFGDWEGIWVDEVFLCCWKWPTLSSFYISSCLRSWK